MKSRFPGYYHPTDEEVAELWQEGTLVVLDTNILLHLYRVPKSTRDQLLSILETIKDRLWIPHQVGIEYQRRRLGVIRDAFVASRKLSTDIEKAYEQLEKAVRAAQPEKRGLHRVQEALDTMQAQATLIRDSIDKAIAGQMSPSEHDTIRDAIDELIGDKVGDPPANQGILKEWYRQGASRFELQMGPGFKDAKKANSPTTQFYAGGLTFESQYGDLVLWKEMIAYASKENIKKVVFVTQDNKEDWWCRVSDSASSEVISQGPLQELAQEIRREAKVDLFWMYHLQEFMEEARKRLGVDVTEDAITDVSAADRVAANRVGIMLSGPVSTSTGTSPLLDVGVHLQVLRRMGLEILSHHDGFSVGAAPKVRKDYGVILTSHVAMWMDPVGTLPIFSELLNTLRGVLDLKYLDIYILCFGSPGEEIASTHNFLREALHILGQTISVTVWTCTLDSAIDGTISPIAGMPL